MGVRIALGARPRDVVRLVVRDGMSLALAGLALGLPAAAASARLLESLLYGVGAFDPASFAAAAALPGGVALAACRLPARGAARVDPLAAIRAE